LGQPVRQASVLACKGSVSACATANKKERKKQRKKEEVFTSSFLLRQVFTYLEIGTKRPFEDIEEEELLIKRETLRY